MIESSIKKKSKRDCRFELFRGGGKPYRRGGRPTYRRAFLPHDNNKNKQKKIIIQSNDVYPEGPPYLVEKRTHLLIFYWIESP